MTLADATAAVVARMLSAGIRATDDERDVNPPAVFVPAPAITYAFRHLTYQWELIACVPDAGRPANLIALGDLIDQVQTALGHEVLSARPVSFAGVEGAAPLPGYALTYSEIVDN